MTKTIFWLSVMAIVTVLVAGSIVVGPIAFADNNGKDHKDNKDNKERVSVTTNFANELGEGVTVLLDTTDSGTLRNVHVAINLPCATGTDPIPNGASVVVGVAGGTLTPLISSGVQNTGFPAPGGLCVYHASSVGNAPGTITDVVLITPNGNPPTTATVTGTYN